MRGDARSSLPTGVKAPVVAQGEHGVCVFGSFAKYEVNGTELSARNGGGTNTEAGSTRPFGTVEHCDIRSEPLGRLGNGGLRNDHRVPGNPAQLGLDIGPAFSPWDMLGHFGTREVGGGKFRPTSPLRIVDPVSEGYLMRNHGEHGEYWDTWGLEAGGWRPEIFSHVDRMEQNSATPNVPLRELPLTKICDRRKNSRESAWSMIMCLPVLQPDAPRPAFAELRRM
ncbi:hypothetical protein LX36DRAFT_672652 [Colletotrichum falcatum]|nr:hypothetical protein LX36DRAFT_672652 [Colletotrichum falcatum]